MARPFTRLEVLQNTLHRLMNQHEAAIFQARADRPPIERWPTAAEDDAFVEANAGLIAMIAKARP